MRTIELRESDIARMRSLNSKNEYGLNESQMLRLINEHKKGDEYKRALIKYRLTDINHHREVVMLEKGLYDDLRDQVKAW